MKLTAPLGCRDGHRRDHLYRLLEPVNESHAAFLNEVNHLAVLRLLDGADYGGFSSNQLHALVMLFLDMRESGMLFALVFWGLWLLPLGRLVSAFAMLAAIGELLFALWLLIEGANVARWQEVTLHAHDGAA